MIRSGFDNFFGMIHVLTRHLAPELDRFLFCPAFWSILYFGRKLNIFGDVLTHGHNWAKMRNKEKRPHTKDGTETCVSSASVFFSAKYSSTITCVLPKPPTRTAYIYPEAAVKEKGIRRRASRDDFQRS